MADRNKKIPPIYWTTLITVTSISFSKKLAVD